MKMRRETPSTEQAHPSGANLTFDLSVKHYNSEEFDFRLVERVSGSKWLGFKSHLS